MPDNTQEELYGRLKAWILANVKTVDNNISFDDASLTSIVTTPTLALQDASKGLYKITTQRLGFKLIISVKANKFRIEASSFTYSGLNNLGSFSAPLEAIEMPGVYIDKITPTVDQGFTSFEEALEKAGKTKAKDW